MLIPRFDEISPDTNSSQATDYSLVLFSKYEITNMTTYLKPEPLPNGIDDFVPRYKVESATPSSATNWTETKSNQRDNMCRLIVDRFQGILALCQ
jgi:hypothetical protein